MNKYLVTSLINGFYQYLVLFGRSKREIREKMVEEYPMLQIINIVLL